eukprot:4253784-Pyramimonas_sp.AAC.1
MEVNGPADQQLREELNALRAQIEVANANLLSPNTTPTSELRGKLRSAETAIAQRLDASEARAPSP